MPTFELLRSLAMPWVLLTGDDFMPCEHADLIGDAKATVATVDGEWQAACARGSADMTQQEFKRDTVHRWAHSIAEQEAATVRRYTPWNNAPWTLRKKHALRRDERRDVAEPAGSPDPGPPQFLSE
jgi:hypothetical protein